MTSRRPERSLLFLPIGLLGFLSIMAVTLTMVIIARGPDTHAHLAEFAPELYDRTEIQYVSLPSAPVVLPEETAVPTPPPPTPVPTPRPGETPIPTPVPTATSTPAPPKEASFAKDVLPILKASCQACHGAVPIKNVNVSSYQALMGARPEGPLVVPGKPAESLLARVLRGKPLQMPPGGAIAEAKVQTIEDWIAQGAQDN